MKENKVKNLKEKALEHFAKENFDKAMKYKSNPIAAKIKAFKKTKKEIQPKDIV